MNQGPTVHRLVSFLGKPPKGTYDKTVYLSPIDPGQTFETAFVADALAYFLKPLEVVILATDEAWNGRGEAIRAQIESHGIPTVRREKLSAGQNESELWSHFEVLKDALRLPVGSMPNSVALDITHGYRSVPFFALESLRFSNWWMTHRLSFLFTMGPSTLGKIIERPSGISLPSAI